MLDPVVPVCNDFFKVNCKARDLISCRDINIGDIRCIDSCYTGLQRLEFAGIRNGNRLPRKLEPSWPPSYIALEQGIDLVQTPFVWQPSVAILGICGTPLLRVVSVFDVSVALVRKHPWIFLSTDIVGYDGPSLYCYAQSCDPFVEEGWKVAEEMCRERKRSGV